MSSPPPSRAALLAALTWMTTLATADQGENNPRTRRSRGTPGSSSTTAPMTPTAPTSTAPAPMTPGLLGVPVTKSLNAKVGGTSKENKDRTLQEMICTKPNWVKWVISATETQRASWGDDMKMNYYTLRALFEVTTEGTLLHRAGPAPMTPQPVSLTHINSGTPATPAPQLCMEEELIRAARTLVLANPEDLEAAALIIYPTGENLTASLLEAAYHISGMK